MNLILKTFWTNSPVPVDKKIENPQLVLKVPIGSVGISADVTKAYVDQQDEAIRGYVDQQVSQIPDAPVESVNGKTGAVLLGAGDVGATTQAYVDLQLGTKADAIAVTQALGTKADLVDGVIPASQLPSYVDDVLEYASWASFPMIGEAGKIYIALDVNKTYRWGGSGYVETGGGGVALGETAATAYRGDRGKIAYDHSQSQGNPHNTAASEILLNGVSFSNTSKVANGDNLSVVAGKLQGQLDTVAPAVWVPASTLGSASTGFDISLFEFAKINGMLFCRGFIKVNSTITAGIPCFSITNNSYKIIRPLTTASKTFSGSFSILNGVSTAQGLRFMVTGNSIDETSALTSIQALEPVTSISSNSEYFAVPANTCLGELVTP